MENEAVEKARAQIVKAAQKMAGQNMLPGSWGNISIKINENAVSVQAEYGAIEHAVKTGDMEKLKMLLNGLEE